MDLFASETARNQGNATMSPAEVSSIYFFLPQISAFKQQQQKRQPIGGPQRFVLAPNPFTDNTVNDHS